VTLASGLNAITQVIEPYVSVKATPYTDALTRPAMGIGLRALKRLMPSDRSRRTRSVHLPEMINSIQRGLLKSGPL
jgi:alcohol dehydrogenase class IV